MSTARIACSYLLALSVKTWIFSRVSCIIACYKVRVKETNVDATLQACVQNVPKKKSNYVTANLSNALEAQISISYLKMLGYFFLPTLHEKLESAYKVKDFGRNVKSVLK